MPLSNPLCPWFNEAAGRPTEVRMSSPPSDSGDDETRISRREASSAVAGRFGLAVRARDGVVHHQERHGKLRVLRVTEETIFAGPPNRMTSAEAATRSLGIAESIIATCLHCPKPSTKAWAADAMTMPVNTASRADALAV
jgi:hypothetical protein